MINVIDLTPNYGVAYYLKQAVVNAARSQGINLQLCTVPIITSKKALLELIKFRNVKSYGLTIKLAAEAFLFATRLLTLFLLPKRKFIYALLSIELNNILIGDCILSAYYRSTKTNIKVQKNFEVFFFVVIKYYTISQNLQAVHREIQYHNSKILLLCHETTGVEEAVRRYCVNQRVSELFYSEHHKGFRLISGHNGISLRRLTSLNQSVYKSINRNQLAEAKEKIGNLVNRTIQYDYLKETDVDTDAKLEILPFPKKKAVIIFLSTLSDAQYLYGIGPFPSLDEFHEQLIEYFLAKDFIVVIKPHPAMFKANDYSKKDQDYYRYLEAKYSVRPTANNIKMSAKFENIFFVSDKISVKELSRVFPGFLCITQHGSVAAECAHLGHLSLVAHNSQFTEEDSFVEILKTPGDLPDHIDHWTKFEGFQKDQYEAIYRYIYVHNIFNIRLYGTHLFSDLVPRNLQSSQIETWLSDYKSKNRNAEEVLTATATASIVSMNNNFETDIVDG